jgi:tetratricopeptide (TPR) repeat protein
MPELREFAHFGYGAKGVEEAYAAGQALLERVEREGDGDDLEWTLSELFRMYCRYGDRERALEAAERLRSVWGSRFTPYMALQIATRLYEDLRDSDAAQAWVGVGLAGTPPRADEVQFLDALQGEAQRFDLLSLRAAILADERDAGPVFREVFEEMANIASRYRFRLYTEALMKALRASAMASASTRAPC